MYAQQGQYESEGLPFGSGDGAEALDDKLDVQVRHGFVRKVFAIVGAQMFLTTLIALPFVLYPTFSRLFIQNNIALLYVAMFMPLALVCYISCNPAAAREFPKNYLILFALTLCMGLTVGVICSVYTTQSVAMVFGMTCLIVFGLVAFASQTKYDFSGMGPYLYCAFLVLFFTSFIMLFTGYSRTFELIYAGAGTLIFSFYIVYDTQLIVGGKHQAQRFSIDDYVFAAINLYLDIINLFIMLLRIFGERR